MTATLPEQTRPITNNSSIDDFFPGTNVTEEELMAIIGKEPYQLVPEGMMGVELYIKNGMFYATIGMPDSNQTTTYNATLERPTSLVESKTITGTFHDSQLPLSEYQRPKYMRKKKFANMMETMDRNRSFQRFMGEYK